MNWHVVEGSWKQIKGMAMVQWGMLTDNRHEVNAGERVELAGRAQKAYGVDKGKADKQLKRFHQEHNGDYHPGGTP